MNKRIHFGFTALLLFGLTACGGTSGEADAPVTEATRAQKDSAVANSGLPGSGAVGKAMDAAAAAGARAERHDTISD